MQANDHDEFLKRRVEQMAAGMQEAIRREVRRRRELGLPIHVVKDGRVIALPATESGGK